VRCHGAVNSEKAVVLTDFKWFGERRAMGEKRCTLVGDLILLGFTHRDCLCCVGGPDWERARVCGGSHKHCCD